MRILTLCLASLLLSACSSSPTYIGRLNQAEIDHVEANARRSGATVIWLHQPEVYYVVDPVTGKT